MKLKLSEALAKLADLRRQGWDHTSEELLLASICAMHSGAESGASVSEWG